MALKKFWHTTDISLNIIERNGLGIYHSENLLDFPKISHTRIIPSLLALFMTSNYFHILELRGFIKA